MQNIERKLLGEVGRLFYILHNDKFYQLKFEFCSSWVKIDCKVFKVLEIVVEIKIYLSKKAWTQPNVLTNQHGHPSGSKFLIC